MTVHRGGLGRLCAGVALRIKPPVGVQGLQRTCQGPLVVLWQAVEVRGQEGTCAAVDHVHTFGTLQLHGELVLEAQCAATSAHAQTLVLIVVQIALDQLLREGRRGEERERISLLMDIIYTMQQVDNNRNIFKGKAGKRETSGGKSFRRDISRSLEETTWKHSERIDQQRNIHFIPDLG